MRAANSLGMYKKGQQGLYERKEISTKTASHRPGASGSRFVSTNVLIYYPSPVKLGRSDYNDIFSERFHERMTDGSAKDLGLRKGSLWPNRMHTMPS
jgi:hypothetical protein